MKAVVKLIERIGEKPKYSVYYREQDNEETLRFVDCFSFDVDASVDDYYYEPKAFAKAMELATKIESRVAGDFDVIIYETQPPKINYN